MALDSIPRRVIGYLQENLPANITAPAELDMTFDALYRSGDHLPICIVAATPSLPEVRAGGAIDTTIRSGMVTLTILWDGSPKGRNYDQFEEVISTLVDTLYRMRGTPTLGSSVLQSYCDPQDVGIVYDQETDILLADIELNVKFIT